MITWYFPGAPEPWVYAEDQCAFCAQPGQPGVPITLRPGGDEDGVLQFGGAAWACNLCVPLLRVKNWVALGVRQSRFVQSLGLGGRRVSPDDAADVCQLIGEHVEEVS